MVERVSLTCTSCGAPLNPAGGESVVTCRYCGSSFLLEGESSMVPVKEHFVVPCRVFAGGLVKSLSVSLAARRLAPRGMEDAVVAGEPVCRYLPYWIVHCRSVTRWTGMDRRIRRRRRQGSDDDDTSEVSYEPRDGTFENEHWWPVYARRGDEYPGQSALRPGELKLVPDWGGHPLGFFGFERNPGQDYAADRVPFDLDIVDGDAAVLNAQVDRDEAFREARQEIELYCWKKAKERVSVLQQCDTSFHPREAVFVHIPFWWLDYEYDGKRYHCLFHGGSGEICYLEYPVGLTARLGMSVAAAACLSGAVWFAVPDPTLRLLLLAAIWTVVLVQAFLSIAGGGGGGAGDDR